MNLPKAEFDVAEGWKVVYMGGGGRFYSAVSLVGLTEYCCHEWVYPLETHGPLTVFASRRDAERFIMLTDLPAPPDCYRIKPCWYIPSRRQGVWTGPIKCLLASLPAGTRLAEAVCLKEWSDEECAP